MESKEIYTFTHENDMLAAYRELRERDIRATPGEFMRYMLWVPDDGWEGELARRVARKHHGFHERPGFEVPSDDWWTATDDGRGTRTEAS